MKKTTDTLPGQADALRKPHRRRNIKEISGMQKTVTNLKKTKKNMKHQIILWTGALLLLMVGVMGCEKEKETNAEETFFSNLQKAPHDIMAKKDFPDWLSEKVNQMEKENKKDICSL